MTADSFHGWLAPYATSPAASRGRLVGEPESPTRSCFQRDRDRIVHSGAFRKLKHKTQVFVYHEGDYYRTRLTHSLEVAQIARSISRALRLNEDLAEAVALAHDLGHTPFGHAGEAALDDCMKPFGGFSHNDQSLRILTRLERRYAAFDGLNLTWETLEGVVKHNGPLLPLPAGAVLPVTIRAFQTVCDLDLDTNPGLEAQVAALADDIAYNNHDIDDGLRAGFFTLEEIAELPLLGPIIGDLRRQWPGLEQPRLVHETIRCMIDRMVSDLLAETGRRIAAADPGGVEEVRRAPRALVAFSAGMDEVQRPLRAFLRQRMYRHYRVNREMSKCKRVVRALFELFMAEPNTLPTSWQVELRDHGGDTDDTMRARLVADYIAGMTDRYALSEHRRLFDVDTKT
ncbi:deoxyguanosinetriphosphate triphosphohydrolase [Azospirillum sp. RWY-5-1]|uniref:Deoxyguanosinetriphosphate triphosphohydrolase-like protein n=1 Tax=Azospirillum oleiclasticum TaxID=2735135 RepID=A0ABX2TCE9_9PROT|nr:deoxyguanosinetriphosphate triphosphohydrolase [Azospirillum oleiclasticum]NYZ14247.1 deoxyguanosinetriphosphate triphosphohydrolase [Azospirillum oleiclasticum]NYZ21732.1 deoxyguanosinetriphosphate triphosphohydrolase [Azospirillum oleiclasticum]